MNRDRLIVWSALVAQAVVAAIELSSVLTAIMTIGISTYAILRARAKSSRKDVDQRQQKEISLAMQALAGGTSLSAVKQVLGTRVFWRQLGRLIAETQSGQRLTIVFVVVTTTTLLLGLRFYNVQQSAFGIICELIVPSLMIATAVLFAQLILTNKSKQWNLRNSNGRLLLPLYCATIILLIIHHQFTGQKLTLLIVSILIVAGVAILSEVLIRGRWLEKNHADPGPDRISTFVSTEKRGNTSRPTILIFATFATLTWSLAVNLDYALPGMQGWMDEKLYSPGTSLTSERFGLAYRYVEDATLSSVRDQLFDAPQAVAFRAYCTVPPGYMRGRVFEVYRGGRWGNAALNDPSSRGRRIAAIPATVAPTADGSTLSRFPIRSGGTGRSLTIEVQNDPVRGSFFFCPLGVETIEGRGSNLRLDRNDVPRAGLSVQHPYRSIVYENPQPLALNQFQTDLYLTPAETVDAFVRTLAERLCGDYPNASSKAAAIQRYLRSQSKYSLDAPQPPYGKEPIIHFLQEKHPAHCEYFATAAALMLRCVDVPCRYVTGYVVDELADNEDYWLARNRNAHAWVEAYDEQQQRWFIVEATPGREIVELQFSRDLDESGRLAAAGIEREDQRSAWLRFLEWISAPAFLNPLQLWLTRARIPLAITVLCLLFFRFFEPLRRRYWHQGHDVWYERVLIMMDRQAAKKGLARNKAETLNQFADRLQVAAAELEPEHPEKLTSLATQYRRYSVARYGGKTWDAVQQLDLS